jgi:transcriptional regulator with XRE-family HTH domain
MTPAQCRAGRALVDMSQAELSRSSIVSRDMIADFETGIRLPSATDLMAMRQALEAAGVDFRNGDQPGVRLRK